MINQGLIIFDLDGTLIDSIMLHAEAFARILHEQYGIAEQISQQVYFRMSGYPIRRQFEQAIKTQGIGELQKIDQHVEDFYSGIRQFDPLLFPDVLSVLQRLWEAGYVLVVCSGNAPDIVERRLVRTGIKPYFRLWLGTDPAQGLRKGEPHFQIVRETLSLSQKEFQLNAMSVGDSPHDIQVARDAGILSVGRANSLNTGLLQESRPDYLISDFGELAQLLMDPTDREKKFRTISSFNCGKNRASADG